jgi:hypothetical protein
LAWEDAAWWAGAQFWGGILGSKAEDKEMPQINDYSLKCIRLIREKLDIVRPFDKAEMDGAG